MGYSTDFVGYIGIEPALNADEVAYLTAFGQSRRFDRPGGPYVVPGNPMAEDVDEARSSGYDTTAPGQPGLWCQWAPDWEGCCLTYDGGEKFYQPVRWLRYLVDHFLKPQALAARSGDEAFTGFTFDHQLDGTIVGSRRDTRELFRIDVVSNRIRKRVLRAGDESYLNMPPLLYEQELDRQKEQRQRRRRVQRAGPLSLRG